MKYQAQLKELVKFFVLQYAVCGLVIWNIRAASRANIPNTIVSDLLFSLVNFTVVRKIASDTGGSKWAMAGYTLGNILGSVSAIYGTRYFCGS